MIKHQDVDRFFVFTLILKGIFAIGEILGGLVAFFISQTFLIDFLQKIIHGGLIKDPNDVVATYLLHGAENMSVSTKHFAAAYLLSHGIIKFWLVVGLIRKILWCYPAAIIVFSFFTVYQIHRYTYTHSVFLIFVTVLDIAIIWLTWLEYRYLIKSQHK